MNVRREVFGQMLEENFKNVKAAVQGQFDNARITSLVKSALVESIPVSATWIDVDTNNGVVFLRGDVANDWVRQEAERIARTVWPRGMTNVVNELTVNPDLPPLFP
ncbi:MAG TPA: BON domain-containing protein [Chloroflexota bacterium]|nr:BON domain-containing protein [Chloroflexota bacterium]